MPLLGTRPSLLRRLLSERRGNIAIMFGLAAIPMIVAVGLAIDLSRGYAVRTRLNAALDDAGLALGSSPASMTTAQLTARLKTFVYANFAVNGLAGAVGAPSFVATNNGNTITVSGTATVQTTLMQLININTMNVAATSVITKGYTNLEVALVLDVTGSMTCGDSGNSPASGCANGVPPSHMDTLRADAKIAIDTLFSNTPPGTSLKIALVPYVTSVNIGLALGGNLNTYVPTAAPNDVNGNPTYYDYNSVAVTGLVHQPIHDANGLNITFDSAAATTSQTSTVNFTNAASTEWMGCVVEPTSAGEVGSSGPDVEDPANWNSITWAPYWWPSDAGGGNSFTGDDSNANQVWTYNNGTQHTAAQYNESGTGDYSTDTNGAYYLSYGPNLGCPQPMQRLTTNQAVLDNLALHLQSRANSGTMIHIGMIWGWRALSPDGGPFKDGAPYTDTSTIKAIILETDGQNDVGYDPDMTGLGMLARGNKMGTPGLGTCPLWVSTSNPSNGTKSACTGVGTTTPGTAAAALTNRLRTVCTNIKAANQTHGGNPIVVYTIGLGQGANGTASAALAACASDSSKFFPAPTAASLATAFNQIAQSLNQLRLSQ
jgi:Flp pilus assembly protein TadG